MGDAVAFDRLADDYDATRGFPPGVAARVAALLREAGGWRQEREAARLMYTRAVRPRQLVETLERRLWSLTWRMSDEALARSVAELQDDLLARFGDLDRAIDVTHAFVVRAWLPPTSAG